MSTGLSWVSLKEVEDELGKIPGMSDLISSERAKAAVAAKSTTMAQMAGEFGVSLRTLRFYEHRRLLRPRHEGKTRLYSDTDRLRLQMIIKGKQLGFTLTEIAELIGLREFPDDFEEKLTPAQIVTQIDHLERQHREIDEALERRRGTHARLTKISASMKTQLR